MPDFKLSEYQEAILKYYKENPQGNMIVEALAGSGKSSTAMLLLDDTKTSDIYVAFNNSIATEFKEKITNKNVKVSTIHSLAYSFMLYNVSRQYKDGDVMYDKPKLDNLKVYKIIDDLIKQNLRRYMTFEQKLFLRENFFNLYNLARLTMTNVHDANKISKLIEKHYLFWDFSEEKENRDVVPSDSMIVTILSNLDAESVRQFEWDGIIDFTDMLYLTYHKIVNGEWKVPYWGYYHNIILDEAQDNNILQVSFLKLIKDKDGRYVFIQDFHQAIYFFSGADAYMAQKISQMFAPVEKFDLPVCYRCAKSHLDYVRRLYPEIDIKARDDAPEGEIETIEKYEIVDYIKPGDMVISRKNKWLGDVINDMISNGIKIFTEDKEMVASLKKLIKPKQYPTVMGQRNHLKAEIKEYQRQLSKKRKEYSKAKENGDEKKEETLSEQLDVVTNLNTKMDNIYLLEKISDSFINKYSSSSSSYKLIDYIDEILSTKPSKDAVRITSVHKAKGLEADNVFVLNQGKVCQGAGSEQAQQERNLSYISLTRAKQNMYLVIEPDAESEGMD